ncbi:Glycosyl transferase, family 2 domain-containing protein [Rozella allomycis CSF55]|uniref:Dolichol-phosphate mannosyltransferase subunit 1 n=1 Tax=Rozella allomycis (strain CSF55) TaxID=988480 RepID=A0A075AYF3_ROZAC|nr:Glycosyl transferase, family 2 domain-containing protein [Rozella allomycis CSF55]|eukprot:EPZ35129.1 Glycosyl transferase, family 2 domain-containing protein [Rozella allomycis CSF55]
MPSTELPKVSIIVPTYKECANLEPLTQRISASLGSIPYELIIVDDNSQDGTSELASKLSKKYPLHLLVRTNERGLSGAVLHGFAASRGQLMICMDADLQHPPEVLGAMVERLKESEFVIGTRYMDGLMKVDEGWPVYRRVISQGARLMARPLTGMSDPMTGYFGIRRDVYERGVRRVSAIGFKICLEMYVKCGVKKHAEVPIDFGVRVHGESKLSSKVIVNYLKHLIELYLYKMPIVIAMIGIMILYVLYMIFSSIQ